MNTATLPASATSTPPVTRKQSQPAGQSTPDPVYLTQEELCARWKKTYMSLYRYRKLGILPSHKIGGFKVLFAMSDILRIEADSVS